MRIGIDIDNTITNSTAAIRKYIKKYGHLYCDNNELLEKEDEIIRGHFKDDFTKKFFKDNSIEISDNVEVKEDVCEIINKLHEEGNTIIFITARSDKYYKNAQEYCSNFLKKHNIYFDKVITGKTYKDKICKEENIDIMIDDAIDTCEDVRKLGMNSLVFNSEVNIDKKTTCDRVSNWKEAYNYIHNL